MEEATLNRLIAEAKANSQLAREQLILSYRPKIAAAACGICGRSLEWNNDDELSIGLIAFNEAIDSFDAGNGKSFWNYAQMVIHNRLVDYFRREAGWKHRVINPPDNDGSSQMLEARQAWDRYRQEEEAMDQADMVARYEEALAGFKVSLDALVKDSPKHKDTKMTLMQVATTIKDTPDLLDKLIRTKQLPIKELALLTGQSRKVLDSGRKYIIALVLILVRREFAAMRTFIKFPVQEGR